MYFDIIVGKKKIIRNIKLWQNTQSLVLNVQYHLRGLQKGEDSSHSL